MLYTILMQNQSGFNVDDIEFVDSIPAHTTYVAGSVSAPPGSTVVSETPTLRITGIDVPAYGQQTITFRVRVDDPVPAGVTQIINQGTVFFDSNGDGVNDSTQLTDGDITQPGEQPTTIPITAVPVLEAEKTDTLFTDADGDGVPSPGDTLLYEVAITNSGNTGATGVTFSDIPDSHTTLVVGSVQTDPPGLTVASGNNSGDTSVEVNIGTIPGRDSVEISFRVTVAQPLPAGVTQVANQGTVTSNELPAEPTDDPDTLPDDDPTQTTIIAAPDLEAFKTDSVFTDADNNGVPSPGDTLLYEVAIVNGGNQDADGSVVYVDLLDDPNLSFLAGTVQTSLGVVVQGNNPGDTSVEISIGTVPGGGGTVDISYQATINSPLPAGVSQVANQGLVFGGNFPTEPTDDPETPEEDDDTETTVLAAPSIEAYKTATLSTDADGNGVPSPGDTLLYQVSVVNNGNQDASGVTFTDLLADPNLTLVVSSVQTSQGTVMTGNNPGDATISVDIGTVLGGDTVDISYRTTIADPLPAGVSQVANQGLVSGRNFPTEPTDDPDSAEEDDDTETTVIAAPDVEAIKRDFLFDDADGNGVPSPGDTLQYIVTVVNNGNQDADGGITYTDLLADPNLTLVAGTVTTTLGTGPVTKGNSPGDTTVVVSIGTLAGGGGSMDVSYRATVASPLPAGVSQVANQGLVSGSNFPAEPTDDPDSGEEDDDTETIVIVQPAVEATKTAVLFDDADDNGVPSPGDTLQYVVTIVNNGNQDASGVAFTDLLADPNLTLVAGTVTTTLGSAPVTTGNTAGDAIVVVNIGTLAGGGGSVDISYQAQIVTPLPAGVSQVANQGLVSGDNFPTEPTDDPDTPEEGDDTETPIVAVPVIEASKTDYVLTRSGLLLSGVGAQPGDSLVYVIHIVNHGNQDADGTVTYTDLIADPNLTLVAGSVRTTVGTVTTGNNPGDTTVVVDIDTLPGHGGEVDISYVVTIADPLPAGVTQVANQGIVSGGNFPTKPTDDPDTPEEDDDTETPVIAAPDVEASKSDFLFTDADGDSVPSPGDTLQYLVTVVNNGNQDAANVTYTDLLEDPNLTLVAGTVATTLGSGVVTTGNGPTDTTVVVDIGILPGGGGSVVISFRARIIDALPPGVTHVANQGLVSGDNFPGEPTDDPDSPEEDDDTETPVTAAPDIEAFKTDLVLAIADPDNDFLPSPGDTLVYLIHIVNNGNQDADGSAVYRDLLTDPNITLVAGSVRTTVGTVTTGNNPGDTTVVVDLGTIPAGGGTVDISYEVTIADPLPAGVTQVANQGLVSGGNFPTEPTDDPDTPEEDDDTQTPVIAAPAIEAFKTDYLNLDADGNNVPSPGDTLLYQVTIINSGNQDADGGVVYTDLLTDPNLTLVAGSVRTTVGSITSGNNPGDTTVVVAIGTVPGRGGTVDISYKARIADPLPADVTHVANQGVATGGNFPTEPTDDPDSRELDDDTETPVTAAPDVEASKTDFLFVDTDGDSVVSPGDTLVYVVTIINHGNQDADGGVTYTDLLGDPNLTLVAGSVRTSLGTVTTGNTSGDTTVVVDVGTIPGGGGTVDISYQATIAFPLPAGVTQVANQGLVMGTNFPQTPTDDPNTDEPDDDTGTPVTAEPGVEAFKATMLLVDADRDGEASPGDTLQYLITIVNNGNQDASDVSFEDTPDPNTTLAVGSVRTSLGAVTTGNNPSDTSVVVDIGTIPGGGGTVDISYEVTINDPLPMAVTEVANQGLVSGDNFPDEPTDDPDTPAEDDPTEVPVSRKPGSIWPGRRIQLPALDTVNCETWLQVQNAGDAFTKAILVIWGDPGACEPQAAGPIKAECSGLIRPGSAWTWKPDQLPSGAKSATVYSLSVGETDTGDIAADVVCEFFAETVLGDDDDWRRFDRAFRDGGSVSWTGGMVTFPDDWGQPLAVTVNRDCPGDNTPSVSVNAAYTGISEPMEGLYDPVSGGYMYHAPLVWASFGIPPNDWNSIIHIQNSGDECTSVELWFQAQEQCLRATIGDILALAPGEAWQFDPNTVVGPFFQGSVWIRASQPLGVVVDQVGQNLFMSYRGFPADNALPGTLPPGGDLFTVGSSVNYAPLTYREYNGWDAGIQVQNLSSVLNAKVKVSFFDASGDIVTTIVDWICPRGSQTFFLPAIAWPNWAFEYVGAARVESQNWWSPGDPSSDAPNVMSVVNLVKYQDSTRTVALEALSYNAFSEPEVLDWQLGTGWPNLGFPVIAIPLVAQSNQGVTTEIAVQNVNPSPGFTDFEVNLYDQNGFIDRVCEKLNEKQVEYIDLSGWSVVHPGFLGSAVIRPVYWNHTPGNVPALAAVGVERVGRVLSDPDVPGDESKGFEGFPINQAVQDPTSPCFPD